MAPVAMDGSEHGVRRCAGLERWNGKRGIRAWSRRVFAKGGGLAEGQWGQRGFNTTHRMVMEGVFGACGRGFVGATSAGAGVASDARWMAGASPGSGVKNECRRRGWSRLASSALPAAFATKDSISLDTKVKTCENSPDDDVDAANDAANDDEDGSIGWEQIHVNKKP